MSTRLIKKNRSKKKLDYDQHVVVVYRSNKNIVAQLIEPKTKKTLATANSYQEKGTKIERSTKVGLKMADIIKKKKITKVLFDRNGYLYHGRVKALAESIRENNVNI
ncbi:50S ribosomal protein L18 [Candidatus Gracilibacteria bacterium]|nr:50S ribosomal protein L18 [Candidatus Gracilibacteria bacterium]